MLAITTTRGLGHHTRTICSKADTKEPLQNQPLNIFKTKNNSLCVIFGFVDVLYPIRKIPTYWSVHCLPQPPYKTRTMTGPTASGAFNLRKFGQKRLNRRKRGPESTPRKHYAIPENSARTMMVMYQKIRATTFIPADGTSKVFCLLTPAPFECALETVRGWLGDKCSLVFISGRLRGI